jgi:hypothetical protein
MRVTITIEGPQPDIVERVAARMGCDYEEAFGRAMALADAVTWELAEEGARMVFNSPNHGPSVFEPAPLYGRGPSLLAAFPEGADLRLPRAASATRSATDEAPRP